MRLSPRALNRTLLLRQHLLERSPIGVEELVGHLIGLQAQAPMPPYLSLAARLADFDPHYLSEALADKRLVRLLTMRSTIHLLLPDDALTLRSFTAPVHARERRVSANITEAGRRTEPADVETAARQALADGPLAVKALGEAMGAELPDLTPAERAHVARLDCPLAQLPPRGQWRRSGGVLLQPVDAWLGRPLGQIDLPELVRRYLRAYGPATAADMTAWSGVTRLAPVFKQLDDLVVHRDDHGKPLYDVADAPLADEDAPAPVRMLGLYDNLWLSHAKRDRVTTPETRAHWMGPNGGTHHTVFADGMLAGLWRIEDDRVVLQALFRDLTADERSQLDDEIERIERLLATP